MHSLFSLLCCHCGADAAPHTQQRFHGSDMSKGFRVSDRREAMLAWSHEVLFSFFFIRMWEVFRGGGLTVTFRVKLT